MTKFLHKIVILLTPIHISLNNLTKLLPVFVIFNICIAIPVLGAETDNFEKLETIREAAEQYALSLLNENEFKDISSSANELDSRLQLKKCEMPLEAFSTNASANNSFNTTRTTIGIRCNGSKPWTLYVPVTIDGKVDVIRTTRQFSRGELLISTGIEKISLPLSKLPANYIKDFSNISTMEFTRNVRPETILTLNSLKIRQIIQRGQEVTIEAKGPGVMVRMNGEALANGSIGDLIPVRNQNSGREIQATVLNGQTVAVKM